jgi:hypothetical protein
MTQFETLNLGKNKQMSIKTKRQSQDDSAFSVRYRIAQVYLRELHKVVTRFYSLIL